MANCIGQNLPQLHLYNISIRIYHMPILSSLVINDALPSVTKRYPMSMMNESVNEPVNVPVSVPVSVPGLMQDPPMSAIDGPESVINQSERAPWQSADLLPTVPAEPHWRVLQGGSLLVVEEGELHRLMQQKPVPDKTNWHGKFSDPPIKGIRLIEFVIPPGEGHMVPAAECPELHADILLRDQARFGAWREVHKQVFHSMMASPLFLVLLLSKNYIWLVWWYVIGAVDAHVSARLVIKRILREPGQYLAACAANLRYGCWMAGNPDKAKVRWRTMALMAGWTVIFVVETLFWDTAGQGQGAIGAAGLVKARIVPEPWRLLTGPMLHASFTHLLFNAMTMFSLGMLLGRMTHYRLVIPVWLASAIGGSLFSWWLVPNASVGASGGLMGLLGCLLAFGWRQRSWLPPMFLRDLLSNLGWIALIGVLAWGGIDNAAHAGGLVTGALIGLWLFRAPRLAFPLRDSRALWAVGVGAEWAALGLTVLTLMKLLP
jgi:membrane associated rhomboid family serine protease